MLHQLQYSSHVPVDVDDVKSSLYNMIPHEIRYLEDRIVQFTLARFDNANSDISFNATTFV